MSLDFKENNLIDLCELVTDGSHHSPPSQVEGYYMASVKDMGSYNFNYSECRKISKEDFDKLVKSGCAPKNDDIVIAKDGSPLSNLFIFKEDHPIVLLSSIAIIRTNSKKILPKFLKYYLENPVIKKYIQTTYTSGSVIPRIILKDFKKFPINYPNIENQNKIINILDDIDKKIVVNQELNKNLQNQLKSIFKSWFFNFDMIDENELKETHLGKIPQDWKITTLGEVTERIKDKVNDNKFKVLSAVNSGHLQLSEDYFKKQVFSKNIEKYIVVKENEFAYNPSRVNIGSIGINDLGFTGCVSPVYVSFRSEKGYENFMNFFIKTKRFNIEVNLRAYGSVRQSLKYEDFSLIELIYPSKKWINKFNNICDCYNNIIKYNTLEIEKLTKLRDTLLPKLMSGEIDVFNIEI